MAKRIGNLVLDRIERWMVALVGDAQPVGGALDIGWQPGDKGDRT